MPCDGNGAPRATGGCLCGAVRYEVHGQLRDVVNCHCGQCRRFHGNVAAYSAATPANLKLTETRGLKWYASSIEARRGFCGECGASLFWEPAGGDRIAIAAGSIDEPTGLHTLRNIFTAHKGDYYEITDGLDALPEGMGG